MFCPMTPSFTTLEHVSRSNQETIMFAVRFRFWFGGGLRSLSALKLFSSQILYLAQSKTVRCCFRWCVCFLETVAAIVVILSG